MAMHLGVYFASPKLFPGDEAGAALVESCEDGTWNVLGSWTGTDAVLRARRLALACGAHVSQEGFTPTDTGEGD